MINVFQDHYYRSFSARGCSGAHIICLLSAYLIIALPFYFSFGGNKFWLDNKTLPVTATYNYTGYYAIQVNRQTPTVAANLAYVTHQFSNIPGNSMTYPSGFGASLVVSDKSTTGTATLTLTGYASTEIVSVNVIMYFDVGLGSIGKNALCGWMWNVAGNIMTANIAATLEYTSSTSISSIASGDQVDLPPYYPNMVGGFTFATLANELVLSGDILRARQQSQVYTSGVNAISIRTVTLNFVKQQSILVNYYPSLLQTLKFKYSTFIAFAIIFYYIFYSLFSLYLKEGLLDCQTVTERLRQY